MQEIYKRLKKDPIFRAVNSKYKLKIIKAYKGVKHG